MSIFFTMNNYMQLIYARFREHLVFIGPKPRRNVRKINKKAARCRNNSNFRGGLRKTRIFWNRACNGVKSSKVADFDTTLSLRSVSRRRSRLHECTPSRSIPSASPCRRQAKIERAQIVLDRSQPGLPGSSGSASPVFGRTPNAGLESAAREWSWLASARQRWPKKDRRRRRIVSDRSGCPVRDRTTSLETKSRHRVCKQQNWLNAVDLVPNVIPVIVILGRIQLCPIAA